eukprot:TRINITY_DN191_c0_g1_i3.p1 TRINITY_DN191_c0_g1~~TRINITY_DN191_c0_g1_i3.p1  ORF type:complete len:117 (-),score=15.77 TRINITY_DN191_c0_g1_i3:557-907(-)
MISSAADSHIWREKVESEESYANYWTERERQQRLKDGDPLYSSMRNATTITSVRSRSVTPIEDGSPLKFPPLKAAKISPTYTVAPSSLTFTHYRIADDVDPNHVRISPYFYLLEGR